MEKEAAQAVANYIQESDNLIQKQASLLSSKDQEIAELKHKLSLAKEASSEAPANTLEPTAVADTVNNCIRAGFIGELDKQAAIDAMVSNGAHALSFLDKLAAKTIQSTALPTLGNGDMEKKASLVGKQNSDDFFEQQFG